MYFFVMQTDAKKEMYIIDPVFHRFGGFQNEVGRIEATDPENAIERLRRKFKQKRVRSIEIYDNGYGYRNGKILAAWNFWRMHPRSINRIWHLAAQNAAAR